MKECDLCGTPVHEKFLILIDDIPVIRETPMGDIEEQMFVCPACAREDEEDLDLMTEEEIFEEENKRFEEEKNKRFEEEELAKFHDSLINATELIALRDIAQAPEVCFVGLWFFSQMTYAMAPSKKAADKTIKAAAAYGCELEHGEADEVSLLKEAYSDFADAARDLAKLIQSKHGEDADCSEEYPFHESFDDISNAITEWASHAEDRLDSQSAPIEEQ